MTPHLLPALAACLGLLAGWRATRWWYDREIERLLDRIPPEA